MKMSKVGNQTNSQDPQAVNSRVFVGNLNTFQCSKTDVERMFQRYGRLVGISMHKGYAFVQFTNPFDARNACMGEDGRTVLSQTLDVNMVAEPKPHQTGRKRQNVTQTGNDWDYYYDSYYASRVGIPIIASSRILPNLKRPRVATPPTRSVKNGQSNHKSGQNNHGSQALIINDLHLKTYSNPDILICGNCREMFTDLKDIINHKKTYCKFRFTCRCQSLEQEERSPNGNGTTSGLLCVQCKDTFPNAWDLMVHVQAAHMVNIYELGTPYGVEKTLDSPIHSDDSTPTSPISTKMEVELSRTSLAQNGNENGEDVLRYGSSTTLNSTSVKDVAVEETESSSVTMQQQPPTCIMHINSVTSDACCKASTLVISNQQQQPLSVALTNGNQ